MLFKTQKWGKSPPPPLVVVPWYNSHAFHSWKLSQHYGNVSKPEEAELSRHHGSSLLQNGWATKGTMEVLLWASRVHHNKHRLGTGCIQHTCHDRRARSGVDGTSASLVPTFHSILRISHCLRPAILYMGGRKKLHPKDMWLKKISITESTQLVAQVGKNLLSNMAKYLTTLYSHHPWSQVHRQKMKTLHIF